MKLEVSAGGIVYRKKGNEFEILLLKDQKGNWTFPKGLIEKGENNIDAAQREIAEEVGLTSTRFVEEIDTVKYFYKWENTLIKKTVHYYLFEFTGREEPIGQKEEGIQEVRWFSPQEALKMIGYQKTNEKILKQAIIKVII